MPSLFKRKPAEVVAAPADDEPAPPEADTARPKGYTPSKRELGRATPKRRDTSRRRVEPPPANRREAAKRARDKRREDREERRAGMLAGDEKYMLPRDRGPERALVRDVVDSRFTIGTWFFAAAFIVIIGSSRAMPPIIQIASNLLWALLAAATLIDSYLLSRQIKRMVTERFPKTTQRMGGLYMYGIMRALTFRKLRMPKPRVRIGQQI